MFTKKPRLTSDQLKNLLTVPCKIEELKPALILIANTGLRRQEIQILKWSNIMSTYDGKHFIRMTVLKTSDLFIHFIPASVRKALGERQSADSYVFPMLNKISYYHLNLYCDQWGKAAGLAHFTLNEVRRAYIYYPMLNQASTEVIPN